MVDRKCQISVAVISTYSQSGAQRANVSVAPAPWGEIENADRRETEPTGRTARYSGPIDPLKYDPILRSAENLGKRR